MFQIDLNMPKSTTIAIHSGLTDGLTLIITQSHIALPNSLKPAQYQSQDLRNYKPMCRACDFFN